MHADWSSIGKVSDQAGVLDLDCLGKELEQLGVCHRRSDVRRSSWVMNKRKSSLCRPAGEEQKKENVAGLAWEEEKPKGPAIAVFLGPPDSGFGYLLLWAFDLGQTGSKLKLENAWASSPTR